MEKALQFYCDYVASQDCFSVLPPMLVAAIRATVQNSESHICRLLFKLAVEMDMMMNVLAAAMEIPEEQLRELRGRCVQEVKKTPGMISLDDAVEYQGGGGGGGGGGEPGSVKKGKKRKAPHHDWQGAE